MKISFRIECPSCHWGHEWRDEYINMGWIALKCSHCDSRFFTKISIPTVDVSLVGFLPEGVPCFTTPEAKMERDFNDDNCDGHEIQMFFDIND